MKKLLFIGLAAALAACAASAAPAAAKKNALDIRPEAAKGDKPAPSAVDWQNKNDAALKAALKCEALAPYFASVEAAGALLAQVQGAYKTDPMVAMKIGTLTQMAMCPKCDKAPASRLVWKEALLKAAEASTDSYRTMFFLDQLRWCGTADQSARIAAIGAKAKDACVKDFVAMVNRELAGNPTGRR